MTEKSKKKPEIKPETSIADAHFVAFLKKHGLSGIKVTTVLAEFGIGSLEQLRLLYKKPENLAKLKQKFTDGNNLTVAEALDDITVESIANAIYFAGNTGAETKAKALMDFLARHDVVGKDNDWDKLLHILLEKDVKSLEDLKTIKSENTTKLTNLTNAIKQWKGEAGDNFEKITTQMVAHALRDVTAVADEDLKEFIRKKNLPPGTEEVLTRFGVTTLGQFKAVKADPAQYAKLKEKLDKEGIINATAQVDAIKVADIDQEIAIANSPDVMAAKKNIAAFAKAIKEVEKLREEVEQYTDAEFNSVKDDVEKKLKAVLQTIKDVSGADFIAATTAAVKTKTSLVEFLNTTVTDAGKVKMSLNDIEKVPEPLAETIRKHSMLYGFLINPGVTELKYQELVNLPENLESMKFATGTQSSITINYKGSETKSFAASSAQQSSSTLATAAKSSGAGFVGSGIAAVSVAASYADSKEASGESQKFESATEAQCGEIHYIYAPKQQVRFDKDKIRLSERAKLRLESIAKLPDYQKNESIMNFYEDFGSHFFLEYTLGGRYEFSAKGRSYSKTNKGLLISAVANTTQWAASASASYAGMGGAVTAAASVKGQTSVASAQGDRFALDFEEASVVVSTAVLGGGGLASRDVWSNNLQYNSTWAVIDRARPIGVWELVRQDSSVNGETKNLAPLLEKLWVRQIFADAVRESHPLLYKYIGSNLDISTCQKLTHAVKLIVKPLDETPVEPDLEIEMVMQTSEKPVPHPRVVAGSTKKGLKLIGGGAMVDYGDGEGSLLTGSYPEGNSWVASAKSHKASSDARVTAYAIYLFDPFDFWEVKMVSAMTGEKSNRPEVTAELPNGYALTGGGARVEWDHKDGGIMLTACCPADKNGTYAGWTAKGKDHDIPDKGNATAWVFGIRPTNGIIPTPANFSIKTQQGSRATLESAGLSPNEVIVGGGASVTYRGGGGLLTCSGPNNDYNNWNAKVKDHLVVDNTLDLTMWVITRKGRTLRNKVISDLNASTIPPEGGYGSLSDDGLAHHMAMLTYYREVGWSDEEIKKSSTDGLRNHFIWAVGQTPSTGNPPGLQALNNRQLVEGYGTLISAMLMREFEAKMLRINLISELNARTTPPQGGYEPLPDDALADNMAILTYYREIGWSDEKIKGYLTGSLRNDLISKIGVALGSDCPPGLQDFNNRVLIHRYGKILSDRDKLILELKAGIKHTEGGYDSCTYDSLADQAAMLAFYRRIPWSDTKIKESTVDGLRNHFIWVISYHKLDDPAALAGLQALRNKELLERYEDVIRGKI